MVKSFQNIVMPALVLSSIASNRKLEKTKMSDVDKCEVTLCGTYFF